MGSGFAAMRHPGMTPSLQAQASGSNALALRILSALVLAPIAIAAAWFDRPWLPLVTAVAGAGMAWEWARLCRAGHLGASGIVMFGAVLTAVAAAATLGVAAGGAASLAGAAVVFWAA